ncbi:hypothetical protein BC936DRAFT_143053 [Jimgerdemannia flammicorona]|uniref:Tryptophan synthase beta chain-like PALP domain-containing protein n=1 Tax=Jimgerdemannia flammicorona TaxID=994334 RepID=A0A433DEH3_9FUNG|nr:hypothetical protein BC936DRAFT_143053 [Jimgerdemannia flammicorona]
MSLRAFSRLYTTVAAAQRVSGQDGKEVLSRSVRESPNRIAFHSPLSPSTSLQITDGFIGAIGNTPLIRLKKLSEETGSEILAKAEFMNPGGSVKDRAALYVVKDAEERGRQFNS